MTTGTNQYIQCVKARLRTQQRKRLRPNAREFWWDLRASHTLTNVLVAVIGMLVTAMLREEKLMN